MVRTRMRTPRGRGRHPPWIAANLNREGFTTRRGTPWQFQYIAAALRAHVETAALSAA